VVAGVILYGLAAVAAVVQVVGVAFATYNLSGLSVSTDYTVGKGTPLTYLAQRTGGTSLIAGGLGVQLLALVCFSLLHFWFTLAVRTRVSGLDAKHAAVYRSVGFKRFLLGKAPTTTVYRSHGLTPRNSYTTGFCPASCLLRLPHCRDGDRCERSPLPKPDRLHDS
jgi:hypothetical protein